MGGIGNAGGVDVSGPMDASPGFNGEPPNTFMTIVYDYSTDSYSIVGNGDFLSAPYSSPGLKYDAATGQYVSCITRTTCAAYPGQDPILFGLRQNPDGTIGTGNISIMSTDLTSGTGMGTFSWLFSGSWNLPSFGGATQVPEPGMLALFAGGAFLPIMRRRKRIKAA
jgi:hypothetical protein